LEQENRPTGSHGRQLTLERTLIVRLSMSDVQSERQRLYAEHDRLVRQHEHLRGAGEHDAEYVDHIRAVERHVAELRSLRERLVGDLAARY
jgi:hypothetical protein